MAEQIIHQDDFILRMLANDDDRAITLLFDQYYEILRDLIDSIIRNPDDSDDLVQELFITIWYKRHTLNFSKPLSRYLLKAAKNRAKNYLRDRKRIQALPLQETDEHENTIITLPADSTLAVDDVARLWATAKARMSSRVRVTFLLSRNFQMTYAEIAEYLGVTVKAVEKNMSVALHVLREVFASYLKLCWPVIPIATCFL